MAKIFKKYTGSILLVKDVKDESFICKRLFMIIFILFNMFSISYGQKDSSILVYAPTIQTSTMRTYYETRLTTVLPNHTFDYVSDVEWQISMNHIF